MAMADAEHSLYLPFYGNITDTYAAYKVDNKMYTPDSFYWLMRTINVFSALNRDMYGKNVRSYWKAYEQKLIKEQKGKDAEIARLKVIVDAWENNPQQQAGVEGLAWGWWDRNIKGTWNKAFSCDTYTDREKDWIEKVRPYEQWVSGVSSEINNAKQRLSPENLQQQRNTLAELEKLNAQKKELIANYNKRINDARTSYQANKDAQKLALEREAQEAAAKEQAKATAKEQAKQTQTIILVGAAIVGGYLLFRKSPTKVNA